ncbi:MAG: aldose 1-epimerase family protein [Nitrososphaeria archaeon]
MVELFNQVYKKFELLKYVGDISQLGGIKLLELSDGVEKGVRCALAKTGPLTFIVAIDRCMDIVNAEYKGVPLAFISPTNVVAPSFFEPEGLGWLRGFFGGLLTTCGLTYAGAPTVDEGEPLGLHGRISYSPAKLLHSEGYWEGDKYILVIEGESREAMIFGPNIRLKRKIEAALGEKRIRIIDKIVNFGWTTQPLMIIYHINLGFPILDENSRLVSTSKTYLPRDEEARENAENFDRFQPPTKGYREKVYIHDLAVDGEGYAHAAIINDKLMNGLGVYIKFRKQELPRLIEWKMMGEGTYVLGLEPSNCFVMGRDKEKQYGTLQYIQPQEEKEFQLEIGIIEGEETKEYEEKIKRIAKEKPKMTTDIKEFIKMASIPK